ncbi:zinc finger FYVE domain-containing protein 9 [Ditylenchus destructor]|uniref:Zinc finger FYVE domain-containing protein 9 n=1 Tax=Ditylenchus destructor TaxID=166010 RepID=A0AAD4NE71_9BILA|nr:zinc finger FYVE domain-containing protein 9 [Ditylenchus destructor]
MAAAFGQLPSQSLPVGWSQRDAYNANCHYYPVPLTNCRHRSPVFDPENTHASVLKVFNDFRNWSYRMAKLPGSYVSLSDSRTQVSLPDWALEELKLIVEANRNMVGWALDFNDRADSHLVCEHNENSGLFQTHIFASHGTTRQVTGATFIIFDGALKSSADKFVISVVEDGVVVRMQADTMTELVKSLLSGEDFRLESPNMDFCIEFYPTMKPMHSRGALISPIDGENLTGKFQYGLVLSRQFRSQNFFIPSSEWALRLSSVINMDKGKFPSALQPKFFEVCEQLVVTILATLEPFVPFLVKYRHRTICLRFQVTDETAWYKTDEWSKIDDDMAAPHYMWTSILDEQMVPFLYSLCARVPNGLHIEMHMAIISVRPLPIGTRDIG